MSAIARANEFPKEKIIASVEKLMCDACSHSVSWDSKDTVEQSEQFGVEQICIMIWRKP